jgi:hypothetical protein
MTYCVLKSIDLINFMNSLICFLVSFAYDVGQVSPVLVMAYCGIFVSFSSCVNLKRHVHLVGIYILGPHALLNSMALVRE